MVTGAGNGLGRAIAHALAAAGARTILVGRNAEKLAAVAAEVGPTAQAEVGDVADESSVTALADRLADEDVSILVNNAGVAGPVAPLVDISVDDWDDGVRRQRPRRVSDVPGLPAGDDRSRGR